jgi:hypothetical protein
VLFVCGYAAVENILYQVADEAGKKTEFVVKKEKKKKKERT